MVRRPLRSSGPFRLFILALAVAAVVALLALADPSPAPNHASRVATERAKLRSLRTEQARIRAAERRDPALLRERARLRRQQRPHFGRVGGGSWPLRSRVEQERMVAALEHSITRDAVARWRARKLNARAYRTVCLHLVRPNVPKPPPPPLSASQAGYECTAVTTAVPASARTDAAIIGFPFWARMNFRTGRYAWCKVNLLPSEHGIGDALAFVPLRPVCDVLPRGGPA
ncbi:MAG: hypothetical protein QOI65_1496 [Thermoleophilaceae bacterium]|nr:hypothetical protein [Thermoleophilaceae bacterium]